MEAPRNFAQTTNLGTHAEACFKRFEKEWDFKHATLSPTSTIKWFHRNSHADREEAFIKDTP